MNVFQIVFIILVSYYLVKTVGKFFYNVIFHSEAHDQRSQRRGGFEDAFKSKKDTGSLHVDYVPNDEQNRKHKNFKGGEYVDYEEV